MVHMVVMIFPAAKNGAFLLVEATAWLHTNVVQKIYLQSRTLGG